jgi:hypothetical protein
MARFPTREADVAALAGDIIHGFTEYAEDFPNPPLTPEDIRAALDDYLAAREATVAAEAASAEAFDAKDDAYENLTDALRDVLRYAEGAVREDEAKLKLIGWGPRKSGTSLQEPGQVRSLEMMRSGPGWIYLDWKPPVDGGPVATYRVESRKRDSGDWELAAMAMDHELVLSGQEEGVELEFHVMAVNKAGRGQPSNIVTAEL